MNDELRKALEKYVEDEAKTNPRIDPKKKAAIVSRLGDEVSKVLGEGVTERLAEGCTSFDCGTKFGCDWF